MSLRTKPPFRADHVGSLLRPAALKTARELHTVRERIWNAVARSFVLEFRKSLELLAPTVPYRIRQVTCEVAEEREAAPFG